MWNEFKRQGKQLAEACTTDVFRELFGKRRKKKQRGGGGLTIKNYYVVNRYFMVKGKKARRF